MFRKRYDTFISTNELQECQNVYVDLDGVVKPRKFNTKGLYYFDGQFWSLRRPMHRRYDV